jgi:CDP-diacylglycerol--glycerol-3-phosphate 3-phosphatidyltransferase
MKNGGRTVKGSGNCNLPNALTLSRIALTPVIVRLLADESRSKDRAAATVLGTAALTDLLDGYLARKQGKETRLGQFLDPLADKIYISSTFLVLSGKRRIPAWIPAVVIGRELAITAFRVYAGLKGREVPASIWGKLKTNSQLLALMLAILDHGSETFPRLKKASLGAAVALTLYSGMDYLLKAGQYLPKSRGEE